jgi:hypothetical protein
MGGFERFLAGAACGIGLDVIAALLPAPGRKGRAALAIALAAVPIPVPFFIDASPPWPAVLSVLLGLAFMRVCEIARAPARFQRKERIVRAGTIFETRLMRRVPRRVPVREWLLCAALIAAGIGALIAAFHLGLPVPPYALAGWPRWIAAAAGGYLLFEGAMHTLVSLLLLIGWEHAPVQRAPIRSRSLAEFWGFRWNRVVSLWLQKNLFEPLARRGSPRLGILLAFAVSALLHFYMVLPAAGLIPALWMAAFFLAHGALSALERPLGVKEWPPAAGRAFVIACFLVTLPLFAEPAMRALGG